MKYNKQYIGLIIFIIILFVGLSYPIHIQLCKTEDYSKGSVEFRKKITDLNERIVALLRIDKEEWKYQGVNMQDVIVSFAKDSSIL